MKKLLFIFMTGILLFPGCESVRTIKTNGTIYNAATYSLNYGFLKKDKYSSGDEYFITLYLTSDSIPSPFESSYSENIASHTLVIDLVSDSPVLSAGKYEFSLNSSEPYYFNVNST